MRCISCAFAVCLMVFVTVTLSGAVSFSAAGTHGAVATDQRLATEEGIRVLKTGGNAVDAAVAIGYTLAVTYPAAGNIGGGGFMLVRRADGTSHFIDFRETAPGASSATMYLDRAGHVVPQRSTVGVLSTGVPGSVAGLEYARKHFGTRSRRELMATAVAYAQNGFTLTEADAAVLSRSAPLLRRFASSRSIFSRAARRSNPGMSCANPISRTPYGRSNGAEPTDSIAARSRAGSPPRRGPLVGYSPRPTSQRTERSSANRYRARIAI
jgi:gamma-glutamyltranspeptidase/glutathione hydrolase